MTEDEAERLGRWLYENIYARHVYDRSWDKISEVMRGEFRADADTIAAEVRRQERTRFAALHGTLAALHGTAAQIDRCYRCGWVNLARPDEDARHFHDLERQLAALDEDEP